MSRALVMLARLRRVALAEARAALTEALGRQDQARAVVRAQSDAIARERVHAMGADGDDARVEAYGRWYAEARERLAASEAAADRAEAVVTQVRAQVTAARGAVEAADQRLATLRAEEMAERERRSQLALDDIAMRRRAN